MEQGHRKSCSGEFNHVQGTLPFGCMMVGWQHWRIVCLEGLSIEDLEDLYLFGRMITGFLPIGAGLALAYRRLKKVVTAVQKPHKASRYRGKGSWVYWTSAESCCRTGCCCLHRLSITLLPIPVACLVFPCCIDSHVLFARAEVFCFLFSN